MQLAYVLQIGGIGFSEMLLIFIIAIFLFGGKKLPEFAKSLGGAVREFRRAMSEVERSVPNLSLETPISHTKQTYAIPEERSARDALIETAKRLGIEVEGKSPKELSDEIVKRTAATTAPTVSD